MKKTLIAYLACPLCGSDFSLENGIWENEEIKEGVLSCTQCGSRYRVRNFIPRFLETDLYVDTFSFEWNRFKDVQIDILNQTDESERTFAEKTGFSPADLKDALVLDAGIGAGRFADVASRWGATVIGVDLSYAVDAAFKNIGLRSNVHIIQADIFNLPFKQGIFRKIYSIGVLHHTPDTKQAFQKLVPLLCKQGEMAVYIYQKNKYNTYSDKWRACTTRMPIRLLYWLSGLSVPAYCLYKIRLFGIGDTLYSWFPASLHPNYRYRWLDTFDWYAPKYQWKHTEEEVVGWFANAGLQDVRMFSPPICVRGKKP